MVRSLLPRSIPLALVGLLLLAATAAAYDPAPGEGGATVRVEGLVANAAGDPIAGAHVHFYHESGFAGNATTGADGRYSMMLPPGWAKGYAWAEGHERAYASGNLSGATATMDFTLGATPQPTAAVEGRVTDGSGAPVAGATIVLSSYVYAYAHDGGASPPSDGARGMMAPCCGSYPSQRTTTDADGRYRLAAYPGDHSLQVYAEGFFSATRPVSLADGQTAHVDVTLEAAPRESVTLSGSIVDAETGMPVKGARVEVYNLQYGRWYPGVSTDELGRFELQTLPGYTRVSVHAYRMGGVMYAGASDTVASSSIRPSPPGCCNEGAARDYFPNTLHVAPAEDERLSVRVVLTPKPMPSIVLTGYVVDAKDDRAIPGVTVYVSNLQTGEWGQAVTDAAGSYRLLVNPGYLSVSTYAPGYFERMDHVTVKADAVALRHDLLLTPGETRYPYSGGYYAYPQSDGPMPGTREGSSGGANPTRDSPPAFTDTASKTRLSGDATYQGSGGDLPPWPGLAAAREQQTKGAPDPVPHGDQRLTVPGAGALLAGLAVAGAALVASRRRG